jgi:hypothetical protein
MFKSTVIAILIALSSATSVFPSDALTRKMPGGPATARTQAAPQNRIYYESPLCATAKRQIAVYSRALSRLDPTSSKHGYAAAIYRQAQQSERDWHDQNCRPFAQTARNDLHNRKL